MLLNLRVLSRGKWIVDVDSLLYMRKAGNSFCFLLHKRMKSVIESYTHFLATCIQPCSLYNLVPCFTRTQRMLILSTFRIEFQSEYSVSFTTSTDNLTRFTNCKQNRGLGVVVGVH
jgi:hypothetical protein